MDLTILLKSIFNFRVKDLTGCTPAQYALTYPHSAVKSPLPISKGCERK